MFGEEFKLLVASADCAGALDVTDDLQHLLDGDELTGLHCFHHLRDRVAASIESINRLSWTMKKPPIIKIVFFLSSLDCLEHGVKQIIVQIHKIKLMKYGMSGQIV